MRKLIYKRIKKVAQVFTASKWWSVDTTQSCLPASAALSKPPLCAEAYKPAYDGSIFGEVERY